MRPKKNKNKNTGDVGDGHVDVDASPEIATEESENALGQNAESVEAGQEAAVDPIEQLRSEVAQWKDKFLRSKAEQQNIARRSSNEISEALRYAGTGLLKSIIEVMDDLDRTIDAVGSDDSNDTLTEGVRLVRNKLQKILSDHSVEVIDASDCAFDPMMHEALMQQPSANHEPGHVIQQIQKGYRLYDRVLRPAKVIVAAQDG